MRGPHFSDCHLVPPKQPLDAFGFLPETRKWGGKAVFKEMGSPNQEARGLAGLAIVRWCADPRGTFIRECFPPKKTAPRGGREIVLIFWSRQRWIACLLVVTPRLDPGLDPASSGGAEHLRRIAALDVKNAVICLNEA